MRTSDLLLIAITCQIGLIPLSCTDTQKAAYGMTHYIKHIVEVSGTVQITIKWSPRSDSNR